MIRKWFLRFLNCISFDFSKGKPLILSNKMGIINFLKMEGVLIFQGLGLRNGVLFPILGIYLK